MEAEFLKALAQIAGVGGVALGIIFLVFRDILAKTIFPRLTREQAYQLIRLMIVATFIVATFGLATWAWVETRQASSATDGEVSEGSATTGTGIANTGTQVIQGDVVIGGAGSKEEQ